MNNKTIKRLAKITTSFYQKTATDFSQSRSTPWEGWNQLIPVISQIKNKPIRILDIACGNGRFAHFLSQKFPKRKLDYLGIDNNGQLLHDAKRMSKTQNQFANFQHINIIDSLLENKPLLKNNLEFDLVVVFGFMHHIPSSKLRQQFLRTLPQYCATNAYCVITFWDFIQAKRLEKKRVEPSLLGINKKTLEPGDYILDWQRGTAALRYVNHASLKERYNLVKMSELKLIDEFRADGKEHNLNHYLVLQK